MKIRSLLLFYLVFGLAYSAFAFSNFFTEDGGDPAKAADQKVYSKNPEANELYIQGMDYLSKGKAWLGGSVENAKMASPKNSAPSPSTARCVRWSALSG